MNKKLGYTFNITCGVKKQYHVTDDLPSRDIFNTSGFPTISDYDDLKQSADDHITLEANLNVSALLLS